MMREENEMVAIVFSHQSDTPDNCRIDENLQDLSVSQVKCVLINPTSRHRGLGTRRRTKRRVVALIALTETPEFPGEMLPKPPQKPGCLGSLDCRLMVILMSVRSAVGTLEWTAFQGKCACQTVLGPRKWSRAGGEGGQCQCRSGGVTPEAASQLLDRTRLDPEAVVPLCGVTPALAAPSRVPRGGRVGVGWVETAPRSKAPPPTKADPEKLPAAFALPGARVGCGGPSIRCANLDPPFAPPLPRTLWQGGRDAPGGARVWSRPIPELVRIAFPPLRASTPAGVLHHPAAAAARGAGGT
jgi:hypothetical protein